MLNLSTRQLRAFLALAELKNFTRAASRMNLSQSAFSSLIRSLEEVVGAKLFIRDTRKTEITEAGIKFEKAARDIIVNFDNSLGYISKELNPIKQITIAVIPSLSAKFLPVSIAKYKRSHPSVDIRIIDALPNICVELIRDQKADFALTTIDDIDIDLKAQVLFFERLYLVCRKDHEFSTRATVPIAALTQYPFIHFTKSTRLRHQIDSAVAPNKLNVAMEVERQEALKGLIESGAGIGLIPSLWLHHFTNDLISIKALSGQGIMREVCLVYDKDKSQSGVAVELITLMKDAMCSLTLSSGEIDQHRLGEFI
ncbi:MAG: LysR family transcriptional regulator [Pusillimonas sp.]